MENSYILMCVAFKDFLRKYWHKRGIKEGDFYYIESREKVGLIKGRICPSSAVWLPSIDDIQKWYLEVNEFVCFSYFMYNFMDWLYELRYLSSADEVTRHVRDDRKLRKECMSLKEVSLLFLFETTFNRTLDESKTKMIVLDEEKDWMFKPELRDFND